MRNIIHSISNTRVCLLLKKKHLQVRKMCTGIYTTFLDLLTSHYLKFRNSSTNLNIIFHFLSKTVKKVHNLNQPAFFVVSFLFQN